MKTKLMILLLSVCAGAGCTVVSANRVFPKLAWYWSADAAVQRDSEAAGAERRRQERRDAQTNTVLFPDN